MEKVLVLLLCSLRLLLSCAGRVPVLMASTERLAVGQIPVRAGHVATAKDLQRYVKPFLPSKLHCLFVFDDLKLSDFAVYGDVYSPDGHGALFQRTKGLLEGAETLTSLHAVDTNEAAPEDLLRALLKKHQPSLRVQHIFPETVDKVESLEHIPGESSLWLVHLPASKQEDGRVAALRQSDAIVGAVERRLKRFGHYNVFITSKIAEDVVDGEQTVFDDNVQRATARHLLATNAPDNGLGKRRCTLVCFSCNDTAGAEACEEPAVLLCYREISVLFSSTVSNKTQRLSAGAGGNGTNANAYPLGQVGGCPVNLTNGTERLNVSLYFNSTNASITVDTTVDLVFQRTTGVPAFNNSQDGSYWEIVTAVVRYNNFVPSNASKSGCKCLYPPDLNHWVYAPLNQSYNCLPSTTWIETPTFRGKNATVEQAKYQEQYCSEDGGSAIVSLTFEGLQVQAYAFTTSPGPRFDMAADCMGYFTGTTWMGIIVVSLLMTGVFLATLAFLATDTPDRFDDPKGKNIQVE